MIHYNWNNNFFIYSLTDERNIDEFLDQLKEDISNAGEYFILWVDCRQYSGPKVGPKMLKKIHQFINEYETYFHEKSLGSLITVNASWITNLIKGIFKLKRPKSVVKILNNYPQVDLYINELENENKTLIGYEIERKLLELEAKKNQMEQNLTNDNLEVEQLVAEIEFLKMQGQDELGLSIQEIRRILYFIEQESVNNLINIR